MLLESFSIYLFLVTGEEGGNENEKERLPMNSKSLEWPPRDLITEDEGRFKHIWKAKNMEKAHAFRSILKLRRIKSQQDRGPLKTIGKHG